MDLNHYIEQLRSNLYERDEELARAIQEVITKQNISGQISQIDTLKQIIAHNYQSASTYSNLIIIAGYAGLFGVWQFTRTYLSKEETLFIALLALISIFIFAGYEIYKMVSSAYFTRKLDQIVRSIPETEVITAYRYAWTEHSLQQSRVWRWQIIPTVLTGYGAGLCLIYAFIRGMRSQRGVHRVSCQVPLFF